MSKPIVSSAPTSYCSGGRLPGRGARLKVTASSSLASGQPFSMQLTQLTRRSPLVTVPVPSLTPQDARPAFMLHWRYNFRHPELRKRDYSAIEHQVRGDRLQIFLSSLCERCCFASHSALELALTPQLRRLTRTLDMLASPSVSRISTGTDMAAWWDAEVARARERARASASASSSGACASAPSPLLASAAAAGSPRSLQTHARAFSTLPLPSASRLAPAARSSGPAGAPPRRHASGTPSSYDGADPVGETAAEKAQAQNEGGADAGADSSDSNAMEGKKEGSPPGQSGKGPGGGGTGKRGTAGERGDAQWGGTLPGHGGT
jgi:hypothetical protein